MINGESPVPAPFAVKDCALIVLSAGRRAQNLREFGLHLAAVPSQSIYHHFWGALLRPGFDDPEHLNDFAAWARRSLNDFRLAERLAMVDPSHFDDLEALRRELLDIVETRIDESEMVPWARADQQFHFAQSQIVVFTTGLTLETPPELLSALPGLSSGSIFYHFIDARRRTPERCDDFTCWLRGWGPRLAPLARRISELDPYFGSLTALREELSAIVARHFVGEAP